MTQDALLGWSAVVVIVAILSLIGIAIKNGDIWELLGFHPTSKSTKNEQKDKSERFWF